MSPVDHHAFASRIRKIRMENYGEDGVPRLAEALEILPRTWENYEAGVTMPAQVALRFVCLTGTEPRWLVTGQGPAYSDRYQSSSGHVSQ